jgi:hypothetical protein
MFKSCLLCEKVLVVGWIKGKTGKKREASSSGVDGFQIKDATLFLDLQTCFQVIPDKCWKSVFDERSWKN